MKDPSHSPRGSLFKHKAKRGEERSFQKCGVKSKVLTVSIIYFRVGRDAAKHEDRKRRGNVLHSPRIANVDHSI